MLPPFLEVKLGFVAMHFLYFPWLWGWSLVIATARWSAQVVKDLDSNLDPIQSLVDKKFSEQPEEETHRLLNSKCWTYRKRMEKGVLPYSIPRGYVPLILCDFFAFTPCQGDSLVWDAMWALWPEAVSPGPLRMLRYGSFHKWRYPKMLGFIREEPIPPFLETSARDYIRLYK